MEVGFLNFLLNRTQNMRIFSCKKDLRRNPSLIIDKLYCNDLEVVSVFAWSIVYKALCNLSVLKPRLFLPVPCNSMYDPVESNV